MAWYSDEEYEFRQDCGLKKHIAASAHKQRTHCGKGGCSLPSDNMTEKERKAMNGECVSYRMNEPMSWETFKSMPDDLKVTYINGLRERWDCTDSALCNMFGISNKYLSLHFKDLGLARPSRGNYKWPREKFLAWSHGADPDAVSEPETPVEAVEVEIDIPAESKVEENQGCSCGHVERKRAIPANGKMTFDGPIEEIVETLRMLLGGAEVTLDVAWTVVEDDPGRCCRAPENKEE